MASVIKYWVAYEKPFWRARGYSGLITSDELPSNLICADSSLSDTGPGFLVGFMEASGGILWSGTIGSFERRRNRTGGAPTGKTRVVCDTSNC